MKRPHATRQPSPRHVRALALSLLWLGEVACPAAFAATPIRLTTPAGSNDLQTIIPGTKLVQGDQLLYLDRPTPGVPIELYMRSIEGSGTPVKFAIPLAPMWNVADYFETGDPHRLLVRTRRSSGSGNPNYYWADLDDPTNVDPANFLFPAASANWIEAISPGGQHGIVQVYNAAVNELGLSSMSLVDNSPPVTHFTPGVHQFLTSYRLSPDGERVVYWLEQGAAPNKQLISSPLDGSAPPVMLDAPVDFSGDYQISADSSRVVYRTPQGVFSADVTGAGASVPLSPTLPIGGTFGHFTSIGDRVLFRSEVVPGVMELFSVPIDGSASPVKLSGALIPEGDVNSTSWRFTAGSEQALFTADALVDGRFDLFARRVDGNGSLVPLGDPLRHGTVVTTFTHENAPLLYLALTPDGDEYELFSTDLSDPASVNSLGARIPKSELQFGDMQLSDDGQWFVYGANFVDHKYQSILAVATDGSTGPFELVSAPFAGDELAGEIEGISVGRILGDNPTMIFSAYGSSKQSVYSLAITPPLPGDFNHDGSVDAADYTVFRNGLGTTYTTTHYLLWKANFGRTDSDGNPSAAHSPAVPEPSALVLLAGWLLSTPRSRRRG